MARPTTKDRILRLLASLGKVYRDEDFCFKALPLCVVRETIGGVRVDEAILDLIHEDVSEHNTFLCDLINGTIAPPGRSHDATGRDDMHLCVQLVHGDPDYIGG